MTTEAITLSSPGAFVAAVPHLIGFEPKESVVITWLKEGRLLVTQRADVEPALADPDGLFQPMVKHAPEEAILVIWSNRSALDSDKVDALIANISTMVSLRDAMWVHDGRWGSMICTDLTCCPKEGQEIDPSLAAEFVGEGSAPVSDRYALIDEYAPAGESTAWAMSLKGEKLEKWRDDAIASFMQSLDEGIDDTPMLNSIGGSLHDIRVRDTILWEMNRLDRDGLMRAYGFAASICRSMGPEDAAPALTLAAILAWQFGDGARANVAIDFALRINPDYSLALLILTSLRAGLPPKAWADSMSTLTREKVRTGQ